jgi:hypothetical protein
MSIEHQLPTMNLLLVEDLNDDSKTIDLLEGDLEALRAVAGWITSFVAKPHPDLGRSGPVCPFVPRALEIGKLWLAAERVGDRTIVEVVELVEGYQQLFKKAQPTGGGDEKYKSFVVVFTDLPDTRASEFFGEVLEHLAVPSYAKDGFMMGGFHEGNEGPSLYSERFRPFTSPVPFLLMRQAVVSDWKFFLDNEVRLDLWARRYGTYGVRALADELRRLPWRSNTDQF